MIILGERNSMRAKKLIIELVGSNFGMEMTELGTDVVKRAAKRIYAILLRLNSETIHNAIISYSCMNKENKVFIKK